MSFSEPSGNVIAISSGDIEIASGTIKIDINLSDKSNSFGDSYTIEVIQAGSIEVDYNFVEDIGDINDFKINVPTFEFQILDTVRNTSDSSDTASFVEMITDLDALDLIVVKMTFNGSSDYYYTTREQTEFSYKDRKVTLKTQHPLVFGVEPYGVTWDSSLFSGKTVPSATYTGSQQYNSVYPKDLIVNYIEALSDSSSTYYNSLLYDVDSTDESGFVNGVKEFVVLESLVSIYGFGAATNVVRGMALSEGAIIGNILGYAFYTPRSDKTASAKATLTADDFMEIELDYSFKNVRQYDFDMKIGDQDLVTDNVSISVSEPVNANGRNNVTVSYGVINGVQGAEWDTSGTIINGILNLFKFGNSNSPSISTVDDTIANNYRDVFRIPRSIGAVDAGSYISGKIIGVDTLKPYGYFYVSSGVHPLVNGRDFRPSYLKYDLINDIIEFEAYEF